MNLPRKLWRRTVDRIHRAAARTEQAETLTLEYREKWEHFKCDLRPEGSGLHSLNCWHRHEARP